MTYINEILSLSKLEAVRHGLAFWLNGLFLIFKLWHKKKYFMMKVGMNLHFI